MIILGVLGIIVGWVFLAAILKKQSKLRVKFVADIYDNDYKWEGESGYKVQRKNPMWPFWLNDHRRYVDPVTLKREIHESKYWPTKERAIERLKQLEKDNRGEVPYIKNKIVYVWNAKDRKGLTKQEQYHAL